jgi:two-component system, cell cycle response regulator DivK
LPHHVILVDDHPVNLRLAAEVLRAGGFVVHSAADGAAALALLESGPADLVLTDIAMPGMDGFELARRIKADPRFATVPVVALTASAMKGDEARVLAAGCDDYITKPVDTRSLAARIASIIERGPRGTGSA